MCRRDRIPGDADGARASAIVTHRPAGVLILRLAGDRQWGSPNLGEQQRKAAQSEKVAMTELDEFLTPTLARQHEAEQALINGDPGPRLAMTSTQDPVTVFGAKVPVRRGWNEVSETLRWLAARWSGSTEYRFELVAADVSGDLAYVVGFEHIANSVVGVPVEPYTLRVTHVFRREDGDWKIAHRHADYVPIDQTLGSKS
jgi:ketosteroid isomerase-like protein